MEGDLTNETDFYPGLFDYSWQTISKEQGEETKREIAWDYVTYLEGK